MRISIDFNEERLAEPARELWSISQDEADYQDPGDLIDAVRSIIDDLEDWLAAARGKAERFAA